MEIHVLDVGAGSCSIVRHDDGAVSVVDVCNGLGLMRPIDYLQGVGIESVMRFILTKPVPQRMDGLKDLLDRFGVRNFWHANVLPDTPVLPENRSINDFTCYMDILLGRNPLCKEIVVTAGYKSKLCNIEVLSPTPGITWQQGIDPADKVLVLLLTTSSGQRILLAEDVGLNAWRYMVADESVRRCLADLDVLVVSGTDFFRDAEVRRIVNPQLVVSRNRLPEGFGDCLRTDGAGAVILANRVDSLAAYVTNFSYAQEVSGQSNPVQHERYRAWLTKYVYRR